MAFLSSVSQSSIPASIPRIRFRLTITFAKGCLPPNATRAGDCSKIFGNNRKKVAPLGLAPLADHRTNDRHKPMILEQTRDRENPQDGAQTVKTSPDCLSWGCLTARPWYNLPRRQSDTPRFASVPPRSTRCHRNWQSPPAAAVCPPRFGSC